jgi:hypothetical protein
MDMASDACNKFVGPMPVDEFLLEFVPEAAEKRPVNEIGFSGATVSQKEALFVSYRIPRGVYAHEYYRSTR